LYLGKSPKREYEIFDEKIDTTIRERKKSICGILGMAMVFSKEKTIAIPKIPDPNNKKSNFGVS